MQESLGQERGHAPAGLPVDPFPGVASVTVTSLADNGIIIILQTRKQGPRPRSHNSQQIQQPPHQKNQGVVVPTVHPPQSTRGAHCSVQLSSLNFLLILKAPDKCKETAAMHRALGVVEGPAAWGCGARVAATTCALV